MGALIELKTNIPDFLIIGAAKCGTSSLAAGLAAHPGVSLLPQEVHYFSKHTHKDDQEYLALFDCPGKVQGEKSPTYLYYLHCHEDIYRLLPEVKLIIILRDPIKRAYSNWNMRYNDKRLISQGCRFNQNHPRVEHLQCLDFDALVDYYLAHQEDLARVFQPPLDIIHRGLYVEQIEHLLHFFQKKNLLILLAERFFKDRKKGYEEICSFLNIPFFDPGNIGIQKKGLYKKDISETARQKLHRFYLPFNHGLCNLLGQEIPEWEKTPNDR